MTDSANGPDLPRPGGVWETPDRTVWADPGPGPTEGIPTGDARLTGQREDGLRSSYFHLRWLGEAD